MYTTTIGREFLKRYNEEKGSNLTAEQLFDEIFFPLFFDHHKYLMTAGNSPMENPKISWEKIMLGEFYPKKHKKAGTKYVYETKDERHKRYHRFKTDKVDQLVVDDSTALGYPTLENITTGTSCQITSIDIVNTKDDIYFSWIGGALSLCTKGGLNILFSDTDLLMDIYKGWRYYRDYLEKNELLKGNQVNTWNSLWICHLYNKRAFQEEHPIYGIKEPEKRKDGILEFSTVSWVEILTRIAQQRPLDNMIGYIFNIGQTNTTIGFIPFNLEQIKYPHALYKKLFGENQYWQDEQRIMRLFGGSIGFKQACQRGEIGLEALMPAGLSEYMRGKKKPKEISGESESDRIITFNTYKTWVVAMLNNEELWKKSNEFAEFLLEYVSEGERKKTDRSNDVQDLMQSITKKAFIDAVTKIITKTNKFELCRNMAQIVHEMPNDTVKYLITLIKLHYETMKKTS
jgi:hypothetical protein